ncbi:MAG: hypothetical protein IIC91_01100 [Chloroflexi bacterium]|nr:hypothetical protein [Chloroflexota bacterium]
MAETPTLEVEPSFIGSLELEGATVPYVNLGQVATIPSRLRVADVEYTYERSFPVRGHSAVLPEAIAELEEGRRVLVAERQDRYLIYLT